MTETDTRNGALGGQLGTTAPRDTTFHGNDPDTVAVSTICRDTPTRCQARTRLYRNGRLAEQGFAVEQISDHLTEPGVTVWLDLRDPDQEDLAVLQEEFGLHPVAIEDALVDRERPKIDRYRTHLFLTAYSARLDVASGELATSELAAFILPGALITIRKDDGLDIGKVVDRWDASPDLAVYGVGYLMHGLLDYIVDGHFEAVQSLDDAVEGLEDDLFAPAAMDLQVQRRSFELRKSLVLLRRVVLPMREVLNTVMRRDLHHVGEEMMPYYQDVYDHVLRAAEWTESLRDLVTTILETNLTIQGNRMNVITKKVTSWAAIIAVPTFITGFYGMNVPYPGFSNHVGFVVASAIMIGSGVLLYWVFRRNDWLLPGHGYSTTSIRSSSWTTSPAVTCSLDMAPPPGSDCISRARAATRRHASASDSTPAVYAAPTSPTEWPATASGVIPAAASVATRPAWTANRAGCANSV
jgi:magnesium transporter